MRIAKIFSRRFGRLALLFSLLGTAAAVAAPLKTPIAQATDPTAVVSASNPVAQPIALGDLSAIRTSAGAVWAGRDAVVVSTNLTGRSNLWRIDLGSHFPVQLAQSDSVQVPLATTPDGFLVFMQDTRGNELWDLYAVPVAGGTSVNLTRSDGHAEMAPRLSPDGALVAMSRRAKEASAVDIVILDRRSGTVRQLTTERDPARLWRPAGWSPDGGTLYATRHNITNTEGTPYRIDVATGAATPIVAEKAGRFISVDHVSPDGMMLAVTSNDGREQTRAGLYDLRTQRFRWLAPTVWEQLAIGFSPDGRQLLVQTNIDGRSKLTLADTSDLRERPLAFDGGVTLPAGAAPWATDGSLLVSHEAGNAPLDLWRVDGQTGERRQLTRFAIASLDPATLPRTEVVAYRSADGTLVSGVLTVPFNLQRDGSNPAVVFPHGGPTAQTVDNFARLATALASRGYIVLQPNFRGSTGYGSAFLEANRKDLGGGDLDDVVAGAHFLTATGYVDAKRIGIVGGSYGGFLTLMALGKYPDVFVAGVDQYGIIDWFTMWENANGELREYQRTLVGDPAKDKVLYERQSPLGHLHRIRAPLLVLQGENDPRVPKSQSEAVVQRVKAQGGTVDAVYYPGEGHGFARIENQQDSRQRVIDWFDRYLKRAGTAPTAD